jgi:hypothetical protein
MGIALPLRSLVNDRWEWESEARLFSLARYELIHYRAPLLEQAKGPLYWFVPKIILSS